MDQHFYCIYSGMRIISLYLIFKSLQSQYENFDIKKNSHKTDLIQFDLKALQIPLEYL